MAIFPFILALHFDPYWAGLTFLSFPAGPGGPPYMLCDTSWPLFLSGFLYFVWLGNSVVGVNVTWISPLRGDVYGSGDTIVGQWDVENPVWSPSFRLCMVDGDVVKKGGPASAQACGAAVRPTVQQSQADGSYVIHMILPDVAISSQCYLEMKDDTGKTSSSPAFSYLPSVEASTDPAGLDAEAMAVPEPSSASAAAPDQPSPPQSATSSASAAQPPAASQSPLSLEDSRIPTPTAAYAVPLSLVSTILVAASGLAIHQRRKLRAERLREQEALKARSSSGHSALDPVRLGVGLGLGFVEPAPAARSVAGSLRDLGHGHRHAPASALSASASMSRMRAWRRDVSRHESGSHVHAPVLPDDEETYVAQSDDGHAASVVSSKAHPPKTGEPPRRPSKAPFYASTGASRGQPRRTTVPAGMFRESPIGLPYSRDGEGGGEHIHRDRATRETKYATYGRRRYIEEEEEEHGRLKRRGSLGHVHRTLGHTSEDYCQEDNTKLDGVMPRDVDLFPIPLSPAQPRRELASVSRKERLHNGRAFDFDRAPRPGGTDRNLYDVVARKVSRGDLV